MPVAVNVFQELRLFAGLKVGASSITLIARFYGAATDLATGRPVAAAVSLSARNLTINPST